MDIARLKEAILLCGWSGYTPWIWGVRGLGKSAVHAQLAEEHGMGLIDMRCSQMEASELRGLPDKLNGRTVYYPPEDLPYGGKSYAEIMEEMGKIESAAKREEYLWSMQNKFNNGILFLDELNRAQDDVIQAVFQLVLSRSIGRYRLPKGWFVSVAGNYAGGSGQYVVNAFNDDAWTSRFCHMHFPSGADAIGDWVSYMSKKYSGNPVTEKAVREVIEFATHDSKILEGPESSHELGFNITPSKRAWETIVNVKTVAATPRVNERTGEPIRFNDRTVWTVIAGLVGTEAANAMERWNCPIKAQDIFAKGVKALESELSKLERGPMVGLNWSIIGFMKSRMTETKYYERLFEYIKWLSASGKDKDLAMSTIQILIQETTKNDSNQNIYAAIASNPLIAEAVREASKKVKWTNPFIDALSSDKELTDLLNKAEKVS